MTAAVSSVFVAASGRVFRDGRRPVPAWLFEIRQQRLSDADRVDLTALYRRCPYYRGRGTCGVDGCWQEPSCITDEPRRGWPREALDVRRIARRVGAVR